MYSVKLTNPSLCSNLGGCIHVCPSGIWQWLNVDGRRLPVPVSQEKCNGCLKCVNICPPKIIEIKEA
jgi:NAD-dependent dihydropyrimidine dehydrogenase PreA subunit